MTALLEPLQADLLTSAFLQDEAAVSAWRRWRDSVDWGAHLDPDAFALLPAVHRNLRRLGVDDPLFPRFKGIVRQSWLQNQRHIAALDATLTGCSRSRVEVLMLPPTSLWAIDPTAMVGPGQLHHWAVAPADAERAIRCLQETGWRSSRIRLPPALLPGFVRGARHIFLEKSDDQRIVLTWGLEHWFDDRARRVWDRVRSVDLGAHAIRILDPTDALEFVVRRSVAGPWLRRMGEVLTIFAAGEGVEWDRLLGELRTRPLPPSWEEGLRFLEPFLVDGAGALVQLDRYCGEWPPAVTDRAGGGGWMARARQDWAAYRHSWGDEYRPTAALVQMPGYLMGRWHLRGASQLLRGLVAWMRYDRRRSAP